MRRLVGILASLLACCLLLAATGAGRALHERHDHPHESAGLVHDHGRPGDPHAPHAHHDCAACAMLASLAHGVIVDGTPAASFPLAPAAIATIVVDDQAVRPRPARADTPSRGPPVA